ncbi:MAG TPA: hypothetical protein VN843_24645 [Anaerolineales bacterium]|nr:hypothetical protein [Anaerolineales bacterium]
MSRKVKMHSGCMGQELVAKRLAEPPAPPCRCKKMVDYAYANELVKRNEASWVITSVKAVEAEVDCSLCSKKTEVEKKTLIVCGECGGTGKVKEPREIKSYNDDIVLLSSVSVDPKNKKYRWNTRAKTPRVPTIEKKHIIRAYIDNLKYAAQRIEEYRTMIQEELGEFGAELKAINSETQKTEIVKPGNPEPTDRRIAYPPGSITFSDGTTNKSWWWELEGRGVDYGRAM